MHELVIRGATIIDGLGLTRCAPMLPSPVVASLRSVTSATTPPR
jgi:hypothetical protein